MSCDFKSLIFDRTKEDIIRYNSLNEKIKLNGFSSLSEEEQNEWNKGLKACLNNTDLNRIEECINYFSNLFDINLNIKLDWSKTDYLNDDNVIRILNNVETVRNLYYYIPEGTPDTPKKPLNTIEKINNIEKILYNKYSYINDNFENKNYCNDNFYSGDLLIGLL